MNLSNLKPAKGSIKKRKRIARGEASGHGGTSTRGHKGAQSRSGYKRKRGFEGGQLPIQKRVPKKGFKNIHRIEFTPLNLDRLQEYIDKYKLETIDIESLKKHKIIGKAEKVKVLARGELKNKIDITVHAISQKAKNVVESLGGKVSIISQ